MRFKPNDQNTKVQQVWEVIQMHRRAPRSEDEASNQIEPFDPEHPVKGAPPIRWGDNPAVTAGNGGGAPIGYERESRTV